MYPADGGSGVSRSRRAGLDGGHWFSFRLGLEARCPVAGGYGLLDVGSRDRGSYRPEGKAGGTPTERDHPHVLTGHRRFRFSDPLE